MPRDTSTTTKDASTPDAVCAAAVDLARVALGEITSPDHIGEHIGVTAEGERLVTHRFMCVMPGYVGWQWAVSVARASRSRTATVCETVLLPGPGALSVPDWTPWSERLRAGDIGVGDLLPTEPDDPRLLPGYTSVDDLELSGIDEVVLTPQWELGLGREQVLSPYGRDDATFRWDAGDRGSSSAMAQAAPGKCFSCGFMIPVGGLIGQHFGACANEFSPADGSLVAMNYGCGGHSSVRPFEGTGVPIADTVIDHVGFDEIDLGDLPLDDGDLPADDAAIVDELLLDTDLSELEPTTIASSSEEDESDNA